MEEAFLHFIWKFQSFNKTELKTAHGEAIEIIKTGNHNSDSGPDFLDARVFIDGIEWAGHIEIHCKSSDWHKHNHETDPAYDNVILHVVYENDSQILRKDNTCLSCLELSDRIDLNLYGNYKSLISSISSVPCSYRLPETLSQVKLSMLDKALFQRLENKGRQVLRLLKDNNNDWEETAYQLLGRNFGFKINGDAFFELTKALPYKLIKKHGDNLLQVEALLFGVANLIPEHPVDAYSLLLKREYAFLSHKYNLSVRELSKGRWKFLRLRPSNFPTVRISQFAAILASANNLFSSLIEATGIKTIEDLFSSVPSEYWKTNYSFNKSSSFTNNGLGKDSIENIIINTVCPLLAAYRIDTDCSAWLDKAVDLLESIRPENNRITKLFGKPAVDINNAFDSQAVIELYNSFCTPRKCLDCAIGIAIVREPQQKYNLS